MLERIREGSQGIIAKSILGLVILTFALAGVGSYLSTPAEVNVAEVNGEKISRADFDQAFQNERSRLQQQFGEMYATLAADSAYMNNFRSEVLERLIDETLQKQFAAELGLRVSDDQVREAIRGMTEFQVDGQFNNDRYQALLRQAGYQPDQFRELMREQMSRNQLLIGLLSSEFATVKDMQLLAKLQQQSRDIEFVRIAAADFAAKVELTEQMLQDYYTTNLQQFETEQKVAVSYVELSAAALASDTEVTEQQVAEYYQANKARYTRDERRQVAHIMLEAEEDNAEVAAKAEAILQQLKAGADFTQLAKAESADTFSAENGGVLDWLAAGDVDPEFERVAFGMKEAGELSPVVRSAYGYHIIKLVTLEPARVQELADVSADIANSIKQDAATAKFYEAQQRLAEVSFEVPDTLEDAAAAVDAKVVSTPLFSRNEATAPLSAPAVMSKIFDSGFIKERLNSEVIELDNQRAIVVRVTDYQPKRTQSLEEVKAQVEAAVRAEQSALLAKAKAEEILAGTAQSSLKAQAEQASLTLEQSADTPRFGGTLDAQIRAKAFAMPRPADKPAIELATLANGDTALVSVLAVKDAEVTMVPEPAQLERLAEQQAEQYYRAVIAALKAKADISRNLREAVRDTQ
ncbi:peptidyl-prolyl cis-trans isomerase D [Rheinheimera pacifica]|uniref:SurA N-terminal domain-containing protein n=1 Tax=Rheinheimera pacifica TaxID=173990 RepID=UPI0028650CD4|nr:SurA N-terminal domain-containing protein [Rheinheimera pacifica]MDR6984592.1 peptidyl-prolyl cis-trans isomerase D [Rheinheimera pacifica]